MMIARAEFATYPPEDERQAWCDWLRHHTINPNAVVVPGFIEADFDTYRVSYLTFDLDERGRRYFGPDTGDVAKSVRVLQLEARPSPFPEQCDTSRATIGQP